MSDAVATVRKKIEESKAKELEINRHFGHADDYERGSMAVTMRWDTAESLCDEIDRLRARVEALEVGLDVIRSYCDRNAIAPWVEVTARRLLGLEE